jgi:signal transduction histidine kinase/ligand-binding sensor domain-containing protein
MRLLFTATPMVSFARHKHRILLLVLALIGGLVNLSTSTFAERLSIKSYTSADGLGSSFVNYLMRDSRGFMWFCTRDGLSRFDGARFVTYRIGDQNSPPGIEWITETRDGSYWVTTTGGLYRFKYDSVSESEAANDSRPRLNAEFITTARGGLLEDRKGNLWYGGDGLYRVEERAGKVSVQKVELNLPLLPKRSFLIGKMSEAADDSLWLDTTQGWVRRLADGRLIFYPYQTVSIAGDRALLVDEDDRLWLANGFDLYVLKPEPPEALANLGQVTVRTLQPTYVLPANTEKAIRLPERAGEILRFSAGDFLTRYTSRRLYQTTDRHIWLTTERELLEFDGRVFHRLTVEQGLPAAMSMIGEDAAGNLWIGGQTTLVRLDRRGLISYGETDGFHSTAIHAINEAKDGTLYFADGDFYLTGFDGKHFATAPLGLEQAPKSLWTSRYAFLDSHNEWWILTNKKLYHFAAANLQRPLATYTSRDGLTGDAMFQIYEDRFGDIWVSVRGDDESNGLSRFERSQNRFHSFTEVEGYPSGKSVSSFAEDRQGNLWLGFYEGGIARYVNQRFTEIHTADGMPQGFITDLHLDREGRLWLSSANGGLSRIDDPGAEKVSFVSLTTDDGLSSNNIRTLTEDHFGNIYAGTVRGIDQISPVTNRIKHYSVNDGLAGDFVVDSRCDKQGRLWFATTSGLSQLRPTTDEGHAPPTIWLGGLSIAGVRQPLPELGIKDIASIELSHTQNNVQVDYFGLEFHAGETLRYQYRLEGADADWRPPTEQRTMTFPNLRPGSYRFLVRAVNAQGVASETPALVSFTILSPVWQRWWFLLLMTLLSAAGVATILRFRHARQLERRQSEEALRRARDRRLLELEQVRRRIAADLHDDIGSNLTQISLLSEVAQRRLNGAEVPVKEQLLNIAKLSGELIDSMSDIVWAINPKKDYLGDLSQRMRLFASDLLTARDIRFRFLSTDFAPDLKAGANIRREFFLIFKEGINNIARHATCTEAEIEFIVNQDRLLLTLTDNGKGFDVTKESNGHGLTTMRERALALGGSLDIVSRPGRGTSLRFSIPLTPEDQEVD